MFNQFIFNFAFVQLEQRKTFFIPITDSWSYVNFVWTLGISRKTPHRAHWYFLDQHQIPTRSKNVRSPVCLSAYPSVRVVSVSLIFSSLQIWQKQWKGHLRHRACLQCSMKWKHLRSRKHQNCFFFAFP